MKRNGATSAGTNLRTRSPALTRAKVSKYVPTTATVLLREADSNRRSCGYEPQMLTTTPSRYGKTGATGGSGKEGSRAPKGVPSHSLADCLVRSNRFLRHPVIERAKATGGVSSRGNAFYPHYCRFISRWAALFRIDGARSNWPLRHFALCCQRSSSRTGSRGLPLRR